MKKPGFDPGNPEHRAQLWRRERIATPVDQIPISNATARGRYSGADLSPSMRPGAMDAYRLPSRVGRRLNFPDGRVAFAS